MFKKFAILIILLTVSCSVFGQSSFVAQGDLSYKSKVEVKEAPIVKKFPESFKGKILVLKDTVTYKNGLPLNVEPDYGALIIYTLVKDNIVFDGTRFGRGTKNVLRHYMIKNKECPMKAEAISLNVDNQILFIIEELPMTGMYLFVMKNLVSNFTLIAYCIEVDS